MGAPAPQQVTPEMMQLAQLAQRLLMGQKGNEYVQKMIRQLAMQIKAAMNSQFMSNPGAESDLASAMQKLNSAVGKMSKTTENSGAPALQSAVADLMQPPEGSGSPQVAQKPQGPAYPLSMAA